MKEEINDENEEEDEEDEDEDEDEEDEEDEENDMCEEKNNMTLVSHKVNNAVLFYMFIFFQS